MPPKSACSRPNFNTPPKGHYQLEIEGVTFEPNSDVTAEVIVYGKLAVAGTDHSAPRYWDCPAVGHADRAAVWSAGGRRHLPHAQMFIAAISTWFGGWVDTVIQRITEINLVLPFLPILIMIGTFYSRSIFVILGAVILLSIFGSRD